MKLTLVNLFPKDSHAQYLLSSYVLKAYLEQEYQFDHEITVLNLPVDTNVDKIYSRVFDTSPQIVGYSCYVWNVDKIINVSRKFLKTKNIVQIIGGPEISLNRILNIGKISGPLFFVIGEGERPLCELISALEISTTVKNPLAGVAFWSDSNLIQGTSSERIDDISQIPSPYLTNCVDPKCFEYKQAFIETQRGCKFRCKYCVYHRQRPSVSYFPLDRVFKELDYFILRERMPLSIRFVDAVLTTDMSRAKQIVNHLLKHREEGQIIPLIYWEFNYDLVDDEFLELVSRLNNKDNITNVDKLKPWDRPQFYGDMSAGYGGHNCVGVQSFCDESLKSMSRAPVKKDKFIAFMKSARNHNILLKMDLILGLPYETFESFFDGIDFFLPYFRGTDHVLNIHRLQILPGSTLEDVVTKFKLKYKSKVPYYVTESPDFNYDDMCWSTKLVAILFRVVNSPLRNRFFDVQQQSGKNVSEFIEGLLVEFLSTKISQESILSTSNSVDDVYWNSTVFKEVSTSWLKTIL